MIDRIEDRMELKALVDYYASESDQKEYQTEGLFWSESWNRYNVG